MYTKWRSSRTPRLYFYMLLQKWISSYSILIIKKFYSLMNHITRKGDLCKMHRYLKKNYAACNMVLCRRSRTPYRVTIAIKERNEKEEREWDRSCVHCLIRVSLIKRSNRAYYVIVYENTARWITRWGATWGISPQESTKNFVISCLW